jgi:hypothetical protein
MKRSQKLLMSLLCPIIGLPLLITSPTVSAQGNDDSREFTYNETTYTLKQCSRSSKNIICSLTIVNNSADIDGFYIYNVYNESYKTNTVDSEGIEYLAHKITVTNKTCDRGCSSLYFRLVKGVVYKVNITFGNVPPSVTTLSLLDIYTYGNSVKFRNVPIVASTSSTITPQPTEVVSNSSTERTNNPNPSSSILSICSRSDKTFVAAETDSFHVSICGRNRPTYYRGSAKKDGNSINLPLSSISKNKYVAKSGIYSYIVTPQYLTVKENGRTILEELVTVVNWR